MFRFLHAADLHLDSPLVGLRAYGDAPVEKIRGATRKALENLVSLAVEEKVSFVLIAGDLYDGDWKDYQTGLFFARQMRHLQDAGIRVFMVLGNHDALSGITKTLHYPDNVYRFPAEKAETVVMDSLRVAIHGRSYATRAVSEDLSASYPTAVPGLFNIGLLHTSLTGREGHEPYAPCTVEGLRSHGYQYWALGHVHARDEVCRDPWIVFPGNIQGRHIRETGPKGATVVTVEDGEVVRVEPHELDVVRWEVLEIDLAGVETRDEAFEKVGEAVDKMRNAGDSRIQAVRILLRGETPVHRDFSAKREHWVNEIRSIALSRGGESFWVEKVVFNTSAPAGEFSYGQDALGALALAISKTAEDQKEVERLSRMFRDLQYRLPNELLYGEGGLNPTDPACVREMILSARDMLLARLFPHASDNQ